MTDKGCKHEPCICDHCMSQDSDDDYFCPLCEIERLWAYIHWLEEKIELVDDLHFFDERDPERKALRENLRTPITP
jgi:hypothetical protein